MTRSWTTEQVQSLPVVVDLVTAGSVLALGRSQSYELARRGEFPVPVLKLGHRYRVTSSSLRDLLGVPAEPAPVVRAATPLPPASGL